MKITEEMIEALRVLKVHARYSSTPHSLREAINVLDNADFFTPIDDAREDGR
jgi:urease alpha subunit